jgi:hypothetical protein
MVKVYLTTKEYDKALALLTSAPRNTPPANRLRTHPVMITIEKATCT